MRKCLIFKGFLLCCILAHFGLKKGNMSRSTSLDYEIEKANSAGNPPIRAPWFFGLSEKTLMLNTWWAKVLRKVRRSYISTFHAEYVRQSIEATREGDCTRCGACCKLVYRCPFLGEDSTNQPFCRIYGELRPASCKTFPFDRIDSEVEECGFVFK